MNDSKQKTTAKSAAPAPTLEVPAAMREMAEKGVQQAKEAYDSYKTIAEDATDALEDSFATVNKSMTNLQAKALDFSKTNVDASFDLAVKMLGVRSLAEAVELQSSFARQQFDVLSKQTREFQELATKVQTEAVKPFRDGVTKAVSQLQRAS
jgi:phasin